MFDNIVYDWLKLLVCHTVEARNHSITSENRCFQLIERFEVFLGVEKWVPQVFLQPVDY